jgi:hypothetical protein
MMIRSNFVERRKNNRFKAKKGPLVEFLKPRLFNLGKPRIVKTASIVDISKEGLSFEYVDKNMWSLDFNELYIGDSIDEIKIEKVPFKVVSDFSISRIQNSTFLRRCGVKFGELTAEQKAQLHYFILDHAISDHPIDRRTHHQEQNQVEELNHRGLDGRKAVERRERALP